MPDKFEATSPFKFNSPPMVKKRNVGDSIDIDEYDNVNSSTKVPRLNSKVDGNTGFYKPLHCIITIEYTIYIRFMDPTKLA
ncbi:unnamed protein product [Lactuca virosa]|uniref:Uncharacterized protein n=1 Tax=Lactuca virosa TaxID=75947 RepID=A0AAU9NUW4_9ASTR|nr:unnamed protein product [Lactuca virosa]